MSTSFDALKSRLADIDALRAASAIMDWDQQTYMPRGGAEARAEHLGILGRLAHETFTSDETQKLVLGASPDNEEEQAMLRVVKREMDLFTKIPTKLVEEKARTAAIAHEEWVKARAENDFKSFAPTLEKMFDFARQEAGYLGYKDSIYDALLDIYEEGSTAADARAMFDAIRGPQVALVKEIQALPETDDSWLYGKWDIAKQKEFTEKIVKAIGFDFNRGRQDTAPHPFCTGWSVGDVRLTTRFKDYLPSSIMGSLHEAGHGMYEQGSPMHWDRTPLAGGVSLGLHESQSRTWENIVGRSRAFWNHFYPALQQAFPELRGYDPDRFYKAINKVKPSLIRVEADEMTYNLHVMTRFEIECDILEGTLAIKDLPEVWNEKYKDYLGVTPDSDSNGCLQDVHWSQGSIGYFPTYSMGNLLSYQIWRALEADVPLPFEKIEKGEFAPILDWLKLKVYSHGKKYTPKDLVLRVTGKPMDPSDYIEGLTAKYRDVYGI